MKRLSHENIRKARRMVANGASFAHTARALNIPRAQLSEELRKSGICPQYMGEEPDPDPAQLVHVNGISGYSGFDLLPEDAQRLHEVRAGNGWYSFHDGYTPDA